MSVGEAVRSPQFIILLLTNFCCCATHSGPIFHTVSYAITCGIAPLTAVTIYSASRAWRDWGGRVDSAFWGTDLGPREFCVAGLFIQAFGATGLLLYAQPLRSFYAIAALFGFTYAGVMPLYSVIARENFPLRMMGTIIGGSAMAGSLGMATGPLLGGWIFDTTASYGWLYIASFGMGIGATLIALTFKPFDQSRLTP